MATLVVLIVLSMKYLCLGTSCPQRELIKYFGPLWVYYGLCVDILILLIYMFTQMD